MARKRKGNPVHGWIVLDKPVGMTSTRAVGRVRWLLNAQKAGHGGTLDPLASGILPIALGEATKTSAYIMDGAKTYRFTVAWGAQTDTDDTEGDIIQTSDLRPTPEAIDAILGEFVGTIPQMPPQYSALKVEGERAYDIARSGEQVDLVPREVQIDRLEVVNHPDDSHTEFEIDCGKGTYVRSLARDFGQKLGCFGHISALRRTRVGPFCETDIISLEKLEELSHIGARQQDLAQVIRSVETVLDDIPALAVNTSDAARLKNGQAVILRGRDAPIHSGTVFVASNGTPVALAELKQGTLHPKRVFNLG
jgi:tRNA pseudouridine55 synthase